MRHGCGIVDLPGPRSVAVGGVRYHFPGSIAADTTFMHAMQNDAVPDYAAALLNDSRYFARPRATDHTTVSPAQR
ncbi:hypothetical protein WM40_17365 [Robbsia andropogonis]|uniref:Uncharacterized protein n=1 Tax=Robbsia andropogonis TaxID=28092 RepID=A0A0F5JX54_9BURK|nr:hypothetical protein [Robbsia andropogonis]KKB62408.1 hypothetical protein WM40_17365 [Robbsia andropogonis]